MDLGVYAHPADVRALAARGGLARLRALGFGEVALAAVYHAGRWLVPWSGGEGVVRFLEDGTVHFRPRERYGLLAPRASRDVAQHAAERTSPLESFAAGAASEGLRAVAWLVVFHNSRLGRLHPELCVENAFGDRYEYALCPSQPAVRDYGLALARDAARHAGLAAIELEAAGFFGHRHGSHHDKASLALDPRLDFLLSFCFCARCRDGLAAHGADPGGLRGRCAVALRRWVDAADALQAPPSGADAEETRARLIDDVGEAPLQAMLAHRRAVQVDFLRDVRAAVPRGVRLAVHAVPDPLATGSSIGQPLADLAGAVDEVVLSFYGQGPAEIARACAAPAARAPAGLDLRLALWPKAPQFRGDDDLRAARAAATAIGAAGLRVYHLGLLPWRTLERAAAALRD